ncbi:hypothetical protein DYB32_007563 [Aphanomyces invadans]|uniref:Uncharacterized protein n=1 Tax=Aphanomyces invadans TaxID=157072 RepID=A0A418AN72_9STRA|nr:hypothetical protein DYB32_007563 [Aphanomyces invadans]
MSGQLCIPSDASDGLGRERDQVFDSESSGSRWRWSPRDGLWAGKVHSGQPRSRLAKAIGVANGDLRPSGTNRGRSVSRLQNAIMDVKQAVGLFLRQLPDEIALEDHETVDDALVRLRKSLQNMNSSNPTFWKLSLVTRMKDLVRDNMSSTIEDAVELAMQEDPTWMLLPSNDGDSPLDAFVDDILAKNPVGFVKVQRQLSDKADGFFLFCIALVPMFFHSDSCDRALVFFWKVIHVVDDCSIQCSLFVDLIATLLALPQAHLCLRKQSLEPSPPPAHQHPPHHHADKQQRHHQLPLLNVCRLVFAFLQLLPATWIYVPNELRTNVMLSACQFLAFSVDDTAPAITTGHGGAAAAVPSEESSKPLPPSSLLAYMDASSHWFTYAEFARAIPSSTTKYSLPVLTAVLSETGESAPLLPRDFGEFRFPYEVANNISAFLVEPAKSLLVQFVAHLIPRMPCQANDTNVAKDARILSNIKEIILPLLIDAVTALPPSKASCERMATLIAQVNGNASRATVVSNLCATAVGLLYYHDLLFDLLPLESLWEPLPSHRSLFGICQLANVPAQVLGSIDATTSYLDFVDHVNDSFWRFLACFDSECMSTSTPEYTKWFGDILWAIVCTGKSRWRQDRSSCPPTKTSAGQTNASTLHWANSWTKAFSQSSENLENAVGCSTLLRKVFQAFGDDAADPFVWTCVTMLSERKLDTEVLAFFTALHSSANSMYVWPLQLRATTTINTPMVRVAAAVEMILHLDFPHHACFWNVLNWGEIMGFVTLACLHGVKAVVFLHLIVLHHVSTYQLNAITTGDELLRLQIQPRLTWSTYESLFNRLREAHYELVADLLNEQPQ